MIKHVSRKLRFFVLNTIDTSFIGFRSCIAKQNEFKRMYNSFHSHSNRNLGYTHVFDTVQRFKSSRTACAETNIMQKIVKSPQNLYLTTRSTLTSSYNHHISYPIVKIITSLHLTTVKASFVRQHTTHLDYHSPPSDPENT